MARGGGTNFGLSKIISLYDVDTINDLIYNNIFEFQQDYSPQHDYESSNYKIVKNIGIVQKTIPILSEEWVLIQFQIVQ
jgi:hypothetical protein